MSAFGKSCLAGIPCPAGQLLDCDMDHLSFVVAQHNNDCDRVAHFQMVSPISNFGYIDYSNIDDVLQQEMYTTDSNTGMGSGGAPFAADPNPIK